MVEQGAILVPSGSWMNAPDSAIIAGLKELPPSSSALVHRHIYFAHAFKHQPGCTALLERFQKGQGHLWDLEYLVDEQGRRVAAFGRAAGLAGCAAGLLVWTGHKGPLQALDSSQKWVKLVQTKLKGAKPRLLVLGAQGRCGSGAIWMADQLGLEVCAWDVAETQSGGPFPALLDYDIVINCIGLHHPIPPFLTMDLLEQHQETKQLQVLVDVSCDATSPHHPFPFYRQCTTLEEPVLHVGDRLLEVVAVDHLPTLIPRESSQEFARQLFPHIQALLMSPQDTCPPVWQRASQVFEEKLSKI
jgi:saccharopine dehydrogenase (NAD+, L-lysine-forming)